MPCSDLPQRTLAGKSLAAPHDDLEEYGTAVRSALRLTEACQPFHIRNIAMTQPFDEPSATWAPPGHYYSPLPAAAEVTADADRIFGRDPLRVPGVDLRVPAQLQFLKDLATLDTSLRLISALHGKETRDLFWGPFVLDYFDEVRAAGHMEALAYDVRRATGDPEVAAWQARNPQKVNAFRDWSERWSVNWSEVAQRK